MIYRFTRTADLASTTYSDTCWTDRAEAMAYGRGVNPADLCGGYLHSATVSDWDLIASWTEACDALAAAGVMIDPDVEPMVYADRQRNRDILAAAGYAGMVYADMGPENAYPHETVRVWDLSVLSIGVTVTVSSAEVAAAWDSLT